MFSVFHRGHTHQAHALGLQVLYADSHVTFFSPPPELRGVIQHECDAYVGQFMGTLYGIPATAEGSIANHATRDLDLIYGCVAQNRLDTLADINGTFLATIYDKRTHELHVVSDRYGTVRAFWGESQGVFYLFPRLHYFRRLGFSLNLDRVMAAQLLTFRYVLSERTILSNTSLVAPGTITTLRGDAGLRQRRYWSWDQFLSRPNRTPAAGTTRDNVNSCAKEMARLWVEAVDHRLRGTDRIVIPLSGGLDSRAILLAALHCKSSADILAFTYGNPGTFDFEISKLVARRAGVQHRSVPFSRRHDYYSEWQDNCLDSDGQVDCAMNFFVGHWRTAAEFSTDFLLGFMGETLGGAHLAPWMITAGDCGPQDTDYLLTLLLLGRWAETPPWHVAKVLGVRDSEYRDFLRPIAHDTIGFDRPPTVIVDRCDYFDYHLRQRRFIAPTTMKCQGQIRFHLPFLDIVFVDFISQLPATLRLGSATYHRMFAQAFPDFIDLPTTNYSGKSLREALHPNRYDTLREIVLGALRGPLAGLRRIVEGPYGPATLVRRNHFDYRHEIRHNQDYASMLRRAQVFAVAEGLVAGPPLEEFWQAHLRGDDDYSRILTSVASLGITCECFGAAVSR